MKKLVMFMVVALLVFCMVSCKQDVEIKTYTVVFDANGAQGDVPKVIQVKEETIMVPSQGSLSMKGYDFVGWNTKKDGSGKVYKESQSIKVDYDIVLYAQWSIHEYPISYELNGGSYPEGRSNPNAYTLETETFTLNNPEKDGYEFLGWKTSEGEEPNKNVSIDKGTTGDLSFTAVWRLAFSIRYDANGGEGYVDRTYKQKGETVKVASSSGISRKGYDFVCWNTSMDGSGTDYKAGDPYSEDEDIRLYAQWKVVKYTISYDLAGGAMHEGKSNPFEYTIESDTFTLENPGREGYVFVGWKEKDSLNETAVENLSIEKGSFGNKSIIAVWRSSSKCVVTFDANGADGGVAPSQLAVYEGDSFSVPSCGSLYKDGCAFYGWNTDSDGTGTTYTGSELIKASGDIVLYAVWKESPLVFTYLSKSNSYYVKCNDYNIVSIVIPFEYNGKPVIGIDFSAFNGCSNLKSITIPKGIKYIEDRAFSGCSSLIEITIPEGVQSIGEEAFLGCRCLSDITIPSSVIRMGKYVFKDCNNLRVEFATGLKKVPYGAFYGASGVLSVTIPSSVTIVGKEAFNECKGLSIVFAEGMTSIPYEALYGASGVVSVKIPSSAKSIGASAFLGCRSLSSITIPKSVIEIGDSAFQYCSGLREVTIPAGVTSIGSSVFKGCTGLTEITIPSSVKDIGELAFANCDSLKSITIPEGVTSIGRYAFSNCLGLTEIRISSSVTHIGTGAFSGCEGLAIAFADGMTKIPSGWGSSGIVSVAMPSSVKEIGNSAFSGCCDLKSITIPDGVASIGSSAFWGCDGLEVLEVDSKNPVFYSEGNCIIRLRNGDKSLVLGCKNSIIPSDVSEIGSFAFSGCRSLAEIIIPEGVLSIANDAFSGCSGLKSMTIPSSVSYVGDNAFSGCSGLKSMAIPSSVSYIGNNAFKDCNSLESIEILEGVTSIGGYAFSNCTSLTCVTIPSSVKKLGKCVFSGCSSLATITMLEGITGIAEDAFRGCSGLKEITIPSGMTSIARSSFEGCSSLRRVTIHSNATTSMEINAFNGLMCLSVVFADDSTMIPKNAFAGASGVVSVTIPSSVKSIGSFAFYYCSGLTEIAIPSGVTSIDEGAFFGCSGLTSITIPASVTEIDSSAFAYCKGIESIRVDSQNPIFYSKGDCIIDKTSGRLVFGCQNSVVPFGVREIGVSAFLGCVGLTQITIPASVTSIGKEAFSDCSGLTSITIPESVTSIGDGAFSDCSGLTGNLVIPSGVMSIGSYAFWCCSGLTGITIPEGVTSIGYSAFYNCSGLSSIVYSGTKSQWNLIQKDRMWNQGTGNYIIHCTDGDIAKN